MVNRNSLAFVVAALFSRQSRARPLRGTSTFQRGPHVPRRIATRAVRWFLCLALLLAGGLYAATRQPAESIEVRLEKLTDDLLQSPKPKGAFAVYARAFAAYAWVNVGLSDARQRPRARAGIDALIAQSLSPALSAPFGKDRIHLGRHRLTPSVAYLGHLALMLEGRSLLGPLSEEQVTLQSALLRHLEGAMSRSPSRLLPSYGRRVWPADNEVLAAALLLATRRAPGSTSTERALTELRQTLDRLEATGLPPAEVDFVSAAEVDVPRGCALAWTVAMRGLSSVSEAATLYERFRSGYFVHSGPLAGFREWPRGVDRPADVNSGPIVLGMGVAASGIGLGAARLADQPEDVRALSTSAQIVLASPVGQKAARTEVARAMWLWAETARPWSSGGEESTAQLPVE